VIYLDHNATTPVHPSVVDVMVPYLTTHWGNPSSSHAAGRAARRGLELAREQVAALIGAHSTEIVFTSGGTESNNLAIHGSLAKKPGRVVTSPLEHPAVHEPLSTVADVHRLSVDPSGRCIVPRELPAGTTLVTVMLAHNETGVLQPVQALAERARSIGATMHTDAAQAVGKIPVDVDALGVDLLTIAGHKLYAPKGVGALYVRRGTALAPFVRGAGHERGLRPGTENVAGIVALGEACRLAATDLADEAGRLYALRERLFAALSGIEGLRRTGSGMAVESLPNTLHLRFPGTTGTRILARCPDLAASTGSACRDGHELPSDSLIAMGLEDADAHGAVRLSLGRSTTQQNIDDAAQMLLRAWADVVQ
jgi:cysteine desulfurase